MQAPDSKGLCGSAALVDIFQVDQFQTLDDALNTKLNKNAVNPVINITSSAYLNNGADMTGVSISGLATVIPVVTVTSSITLSVVYNSSNMFKPTSIFNIQFTLNARAVLPFIEGIGTPQSSMIFNTLTISYNPTSSAPLISCSSFGSLQFTGISVIKNPSYLLRNADEASNICGILSDSPALLIKDSMGLISSSSFQNVDTGMYFVRSVILHHVFIAFCLFYFFFFFFFLRSYCSD
jgi:hypothetical protein